jgi:hypothetical protein
MANNLDTPKPAAVAADGMVPLTPEQLVEQLRILRQHIPDFAPLTASDSLALRRTAKVGDELVQAATNTVGAAPIVATAIGKDAEAMRNERVEVARWGAVEDELRTMFKGVAAANLARRHRLGESSLHAYLISGQLVKQRAYADLLPHVQEMRRVRRARRRAKKEVPEAPAPPAPNPQNPQKP